MLYSFKSKQSLYIVSNNEAPRIPGTPKRIVVTANHLTPYNEVFDYNNPRPRPPSDYEFSAIDDWKIQGDNRVWRVHHVQTLMKPATKVDGSSVVSYLAILEQVMVNPEKELDLAVNIKDGEQQYLRRFGNLIVEDDV